MLITILNPKSPTQPFPAASKALTEPDGLLAIGGCLSTPRLLTAYRNGIFPWYNAGEPILWWSPNPRLVLLPTELKIAQSLRKTLRSGKFRVTFDGAFADVLNGCAAPRGSDASTWITPAIKRAYGELFNSGAAHSVETWHDGKLVGGLYGVTIGQTFFGESMFHHQTDASKVAFVTLVQHLLVWGYQLIDCQVHSGHLVSLGAKAIPRSEFIALLNNYCEQAVSTEAWRNKLR
jgi:leucyl/phenylalanyl-tRNA--protein transferase